MNEGQIFGVDLITYILQRDEIHNNFKTLVINTLNDEDVKKETINVLEYITSQKQSEEILAKYLNTVFMRKDILHNLTQLLTASVCYTIEDKATQKIFLDFMLQVS